MGIPQTRTGHSGNSMLESANTSWSQNTVTTRRQSANTSQPQNNTVITHHQHTSTPETQVHMLSLPKSQHNALVRCSTNTASKIQTSTTISCTIQKPYSMDYSLTHLQLTTGDAYTLTCTFDFLYCQFVIIMYISHVRNYLASYS